MTAVGWPGRCAVGRATDEILVLAVGAVAADLARALEETQPTRFRVQTAVGLLDALALTGPQPPDVLVLETTAAETERNEVWRRLSMHYGGQGTRRAATDRPAVARGTGTLPDRG